MLVVPVGTAPAQYITDEEFLKAAQKGNLTKVKEALTVGVDVSAINHKGLTAQDYARARGHEELVELLKNYRGNKPASARANKLHAPRRALANHSAAEEQVESFFETEAIGVAFYHLSESPKELPWKYALNPKDVPEAQMGGFKRACKIVEDKYPGRTDAMNIGLYDINNDGVLDVFTLDTDVFQCGTDGCPFKILVSCKNGEWREMFKRLERDPPGILPSRYLGFNDLSTSYVSAARPSVSVLIWRYDGWAYETLYLREYRHYSDIGIARTWAYPYDYVAYDSRIGMLKRVLDVR